MFNLSENLSLYDVFKLCHAKLLPDGCILLERRDGGFRELWPVGNERIVQHMNDELEDNQ